MTSGKRGSTALFIKDAIAAHGEKYDYSLVDYRGCRTPITIICPKHGAFEQKPYIHIGGHGCPLCSADAGRTGSFGFGVNNATRESKNPANKKWREMIRRCYDKKYQSYKNSYTGCSVCEEWRDYESFKEWFYDPQNGYKDGYQLDKDLLKKGNKVYSPDTCCFVPPEINSIILNGKESRGKYPVGVTFQNGRYLARMSVRTRSGQKTRHLGSYNTAAEAFLAYKRGKEGHIREIADEYYKNGEITQRVRDALVNFEIEITD